MSVIAATILVIAPVPQVEQVDAAYDDLSSGRNAEAAARLEDKQHPASLINLGIAKARQGELHEARRLFERAASMAQRYELETARGTWVDSRTLAHKALAALDNGTFSRVTATRTAAR